MGLALPLSVSACRPSGRTLGELGRGLRVHGAWVRWSRPEMPGSPGPLEGHFADSGGLGGPGRGAPEEPTSNCRARSESGARLGPLPFKNHRPREGAQLEARRAPPCFKFMPSHVRLLKAGAVTIAAPGPASSPAGGRWDLLVGRTRDPRQVGTGG